MSVWGNISKRADGTLKRKEEEKIDYSPYATKDLIDNITAPLTFYGAVKSEKELPSSPNTGTIFCIGNSGKIVVYTGKEWVSITSSDTIESNKLQI